MCVGSSNNTIGLAQKTNVNQSKTCTEHVRLPRLRYSGSLWLFSKTLNWPAAMGYFLAAGSDLVNNVLLAWMRLIGIGNMMVELCSAAMLFRVWRYRNWKTDMFFLRHKYFFGCDVSLLSCSHHVQFVQLRDMKNFMKSLSGWFDWSCPCSPSLK